MPCKVSFFYVAGENGWSETFYSTQNIPADVAAAFSTNLYKASMAFRYNGCFLKAVRISTQFVNPKKHLLIRPFPVAQGQRIPADLIGPDTADSSDVSNIKGGQDPTISRNIWFRGLLDSDISRDQFGNDYETAVMKKLLDTYVTELVKSNLGIQAFVQPPNGGLIWNSVHKVWNDTTVTGNPYNHTAFAVLTTDTQPAFGSIIRFRGVDPSLPGWPRVCRVVEGPITIGVFNWYGIVYSLPNGAQRSPSFMQWTNAQYTQYSLGERSFVRFGSHKTGRPFGLLRGRQRATGVRR